MAKYISALFAVVVLGSLLVVAGCGEKSEPPLTTDSLPANNKMDSNSSGEGVSPNIPKAPDRGRK